MSREFLKILKELQHRLLDLTSRNKLLSFKFPRATSLKFNSDDVDSIYKKVIDDQGSLRIDGVPPPDIRPRPDVNQHAQSIRWRPSGDLPVSLYEDNLLAILRKIDREANSSISETGTNTLFLILGFLEYQESRDSEVTYQAPLVCVPVKLEKKSYRNTTKYYLSSNGDEIQENLSLREKLKRDFGILLPEFDDESFDITAYLKAVEKATRSVSSFKVNRDAALGFLIFKGMLMIKDLDKESWTVGRNGNALLEHPTLKKLFGEMGTTENVSISNSQDEVSYNVDEPAYAKLPLVYDADHSQHSALIDVLVRGKDVVIQGPPGTGKSQTITNIIAGALDKGLTVLFVAEKLAALEVVKHRLDNVGLEPMLLELHSDKANKKSVLESLAKRLDHNFTTYAGLNGDMDSLKRSIDELNRYSKMMKVSLQEELNLTVHSTLWRFIHLRESGIGPTVFESQYKVSDAISIKIDELSERIDYLVEMKSALDAVGMDLSSHPFHGFHPNTPTPSLLTELKNTLSEFNSQLTGFKKQVTKFEEYSKGKPGPSLKSLPEMIDHLNGWIDRAEEFGFEDLLNRITQSQNELGHFLHLTEQLSELDSSIRSYQQLVTDYSQTLKNIETISVTELALVQSFVDTLEEAKVNALIEQLPELKDRVQGIFKQTFETFKSLAGILEKYSVQVDGTRSQLNLWINLGEILEQVPLGAYTMQSERLCRTRSLNQLQELIALKQAILARDEELGQKIYFDLLPAADELSQAIRTLRAGTDWYRIFSSEYRSSVRLHKSLDRLKRPIEAKNRLIELEAIADLIDKKRNWKEHNAWMDVVGEPCSMEIDLDSLHALSAWNAQLASALKVPSEKLDLVWMDQVVGIVRDGRIQEVNVLLDQLEKQMNLLLVELPGLGSHIAGEGYIQTARLYQQFADRITTLTPFIEKHSHGAGTLTALRDGIQQLLDARDLRAGLASRTDLDWLGDVYKDVTTDTQTARIGIEIIEQLSNLPVNDELKRYLLGRKPLTTAKEMVQILKKVVLCDNATDTFKEKMSSIGRFKYQQWVRLPVAAKPSDHLSRLIEKGEKVLAAEESIYTWAQYWNLRSTAAKMGVEPFIEGMEKGTLEGSRIADIYKLAVYNTLLSDFMMDHPGFNSWTGAKMSQLKKALKERDRMIIKKRGRAIAEKRSHYSILDPGNDSTRVDEKTEIYLINHLINQARPRVPLRKLMYRAPKTILALKPCFMMSPQSVVRFLAPGQIKFDLLVMDEASQLKPEEAISAIARAKQVVVVGDSKQLPPTSFFQTNMDAQLDEEDEGGSTMTDVESILEIGSRAFGQSRSLKVHYRSRHQSLVAFSNSHFYDNKLLLFPSPFEPNFRYGVRALYMANAYFQDGLNPVEAAKVVDVIIDHVSTRRNESLGVVAVNLKQSDLIAELLEQRVQDNPALGAWIDDLPERLFIKNLENVQGDERDVMIISTTYGPKPNTTVVQQRFGPIGYENGWRRLNVLFTRARNSMIVCTSMRPADIKVDEHSNLGVRTLKNYLEYVYNGCSLTETTSIHEPESDFEDSVIGILKANGYEAIPQLGVGGYRIDIAVKHPHYEGLYLAAIECDGATYHSSTSARERDRIRQEILEQLGWQGKIWRIWSTDWFQRPEEEKRKLLGFLADRALELQEIYPQVQSWEVIGNEPVGQSSQQMRGGVEVIEESLFVTGIDQTLLGEDVVEIGDVITYVDLEHPDVNLTATIVRGKSDEATRTYRYDTPFAMAMLDNAVGEIAELKLRDKVKQFKIQNILKLSDN